MRIRRRPQPSPHQASDPATSASPSRTPQNAARDRGCREGGDDDEEGRPRADADLAGRKSGTARRLALPQQQEDNAVDSGVSAGAGRGAGDAHMRRGTVENGHRGWDQEDGVTWTGAVGSKPGPAAAKVEDEEERAGDGGALRHVAPAAAAAAAAVVAVKDEAEAGNGSVIVVGCAANKKRRGPAVLLEGSRCSRVNGRGWRCSRPTLVGYSLCEHHLGKGRARR